MARLRTTHLAAIRGRSLPPFGYQAISHGKYVDAACPTPPFGGKDAGMNEQDQKQAPSRPRLGGGIFLFIGLLVGSIAGVALNEPSLGMISGFGAGGLIAILVWLFDSKRGGEGR